MTPAAPHKAEDAPLAVVRLRHVSKSFPGVQALRDVSFELLAGEVHGLVGANGAGKSTMIRMLSGASTPDSGEIEVGGAPLVNDDPRHLRAAGISAIYQELTIIPEMTALSNAFLGGAPMRRGVPDLARMRMRYAELASRTGVSIGPKVKAGALAIANKQILEIMRAVLAEGRVLIMDEPTASLGPFERERLYDLVRRLRSEGIAIIFISHDLDEVLRLCDRVSVMREGRLLETRPARPGASTAWWRRCSAMGTSRGRRPGCGRSVHPCCSVRRLSVPDRVADINYALDR